MDKIELGMAVQDQITEFKGVVVGIVYYISGCNQALVLPKIKEGDSTKYPDSQWIDIQRLLVDKFTHKVVLEKEKTPGFDKAPSKR